MRHVWVAAAFVGMLLVGILVGLAFGAEAGSKTVPHPRRAPLPWKEPSRRNPRSPRPRLPPRREPPLLPLLPGAWVA